MNELKTGYYNKNLKDITKDISVKHNKQFGAILFITNSFKHLYSYLDKTKEDNLLVDVFNGYCTFYIKVYRHNL